MCIQTIRVQGGLEMCNMKEDIQIASVAGKYVISLLCRIVSQGEKPETSG